MYFLRVSPKRMGSFWLVSIAMRCGASGMNGFGSRRLMTVPMNSYGFSTPGSVTTGIASM